MCVNICARKYQIINNNLNPKTIRNEAMSQCQLDLIYMHNPYQHYHNEHRHHRTLHHCLIARNHTMINMIINSVMIVAVTIKII